jgi:hypothetical protein
VLSRPQNNFEGRFESFSRRSNRDVEDRCPKRLAKATARDLKIISKDGSNLLVVVAFREIDICRRHLSPRRERAEIIEMNHFNVAAALSKKVPTTIE